MLSTSNHITVFETKTKYRSYFLVLIITCITLFICFIFDPFFSSRLHLRRTLRTIHPIFSTFAQTYDGPYVLLYKNEWEVNDNGTINATMFINWVNLPLFQDSGRHMKTISNYQNISRINVELTTSDGNSNVTVPLNFTYLKRAVYYNIGPTQTATATVRISYQLSNAFCGDTERLSFEPSWISRWSIPVTTNEYSFKLPWEDPETKVSLGQIENINNQNKNRTLVFGNVSSQSPCITWVNNRTYRWPRRACSTVCVQEHGSFWDWPSAYATTIIGCILLFLLTILITMCQPCLKPHHLCLCFNLTRGHSPLNHMQVHPFLSSDLPTGVTCPRWAPRLLCFMFWFCFWSIIGLVISVSHGHETGTLSDETLRILSAIAFIMTGVAIIVLFPIILGLIGFVCYDERCSPAREIKRNLISEPLPNSSRSFTGSPSAVSVRL